MRKRDDQAAFVEGLRWAYQMLQALRERGSGAEEMLAEVKRKLEAEEALIDDNPRASSGLPRR